MNSYFFATSDDIGDSVLRIIDLSQHEGSIVFSHFGVELFGRGQQDVFIERSHLFHAAKSFVGHPHIQFDSQNL